MSPPVNDFPNLTSQPPPLIPSLPKGQPSAPQSATGRLADRSPRHPPLQFDGPASGLTRDCRLPRESASAAITLSNAKAQLICEWQVWHKPRDDSPATQLSATLALPRHAATNYPPLSGEASWLLPPGGPSQLASPPAHGVGREVEATEHALLRPPMRQGVLSETVDLRSAWHDTAATEMPAAFVRRTLTASALPRTGAEVMGLPPYSSSSTHMPPIASSWSPSAPLPHPAATTCARCVCDRRTSRVPACTPPDPPISATTTV